MNNYLIIKNDSDNWDMARTIRANCFEMASEFYADSLTNFDWEYSNLEIQVKQEGTEVIRKFEIEGHLEFDVLEIVKE